MWTGIAFDVHLQTAVITVHVQAMVRAGVQVTEKKEAPSLQKTGK